MAPLLQELEQIISLYNTVIGYKPLAGEPDYQDVLSFYARLQNHSTVPMKNHTDPIMYANTYISKYQDNSVCILIPGTQFDIYGTRHGRGGGWYDRFLSKVPIDWLRVGVVYISNLAAVPISKNPWDEPVDWILIKNDMYWEVYETKARVC